MSQVASSSVFQTWNDQQVPSYSHHNSETNEPFSSFPRNAEHHPGSSSASSSRIQSPQPSSRYNEQYPSFPLKNRTTHSTTSAYHPYRTGPPPSHSSPPKPILFVDATFQPGDSASSIYSGVGLPQCRPKRKRITMEQLTKLLDVFDETDNPCFDVREQVGNEIGMSNREVQVWFQNRRAKVTRERSAVLNKASPPQSSVSPTEPTPSTSSTSVPTNHAHHLRTESLSSGQHQWRFANPHTNDHSSQRNSMRYSSAQQLEASTSVPHYRKMFGDQRILLPRSSSPLPSPEVLSNASNASSSYFANITTPPLSYTATTPGASSPNAGHVFGDYARSEGTSPLIPLSSPSNAFNRLALRSPGTQITEREPFFFAAEMPSPNPSETEEYIHLAPLRGWDPTATPKSLPDFSGSRRRSISNPEHQLPLRSPHPTASTTPRVRPSHVRLPSIRDLLNPVESPAGTPSLSTTPTISAPSTSASPATPFAYSPNLPTESNFTYNPIPQPYGRPNLVSRHSVDTVQSSSSSSYRPNFRRFRSDEGEMAGLGVLAAVSERVSQRSPHSRV